MLNSFVPNELLGRHSENMWHGGIVWYIGGATDEAFQEQCFLWERGASVGAEFRLLQFQDLSHANKPIKTQMVFFNGDHLEYFIVTQLILIIFYDDKRLLMALFFTIRKRQYNHSVLIQILYLCMIHAKCSWLPAFCIILMVYSMNPPVGVNSVHAL